MFIGDSQQIKAQAVNNPQAKDVSMKVLIGAAEGWEGHVMRQFELEPGGYTPKHSHPWPHINYVLEGEGTLYKAEGEQPIQKGSVAYVPAGELHQFKNVGQEKLVFICIVPKEGHQ
jgi:quercetin dioxygenase-like cupin family protein